MPEEKALIGAMDRIGVARLARARGLPVPIAEHVAAVIVGSGLPEDRRDEVFREMVDHFEDGLAAGRSPEELLESSGDGARVSRLIRRQKRVVTPPNLGGTGSGDGALLRLRHNIRHGFRRLAARPAFTATAILSLALGIGANAAMFTLVNDVILRKPPIDQPDRLIDIYASTLEASFVPLPHAELEDLAREATEVFDAVGGSKFTFAPRRDSDVPEQVVVELVTSNFFQVLGLRPALGRFIEPADAPGPGSGDAVVLGHSYWRRAFGGDPAVIGRPLRLGDGTFTIVGVAPAEYGGSILGFATEVFAPVTMIAQIDRLTSGDHFTDRDNHGTFVRARLRPTATIEEARVVLARIAERYKEERLGVWQGDDAFALLPASEVIVFPPIDRVLVPVAWMLMIIVGLVLAIACANLAAFLLARAMDRRKEIAVRLALGSSRGQLVSQLLVETTILALAGGAVGLVLGRSVLRLVLSADLPLPLPLGFELAMDWRVLTFAIGVSIAAGVLFGLAPALQSTRLDLASVIRDESAVGGRSTGRLRSILVAGQVAVSVVLLVAAGLFVRSLDVVRNVDPGFGASPASLVWTGLQPNRTPAQLRQDADLIARRIAELPGVETVGLIDQLPLDVMGRSSSLIRVDGVELPPGRLGWEVDRAAIDTGFIAAAGLRLARGRNFTPADADTAWRVAIVSAAFVDRFWPGEDGVGRQFRREDGGTVEIVGVVENIKARSLAEGPRPYFFVPQNGSPVLWFVARTTGDAEALVPTMTRAMLEANPELMMILSRTMARHLEIQSLPIKLGATALAVFALLALTMASVGLYGTVSYAVAQRSREVGIRLSLGADRGAVVRLLLWSGLRLVFIGAAVGLGLAGGGALLIQGLLVGTPAFDPVTFAVVPTVLLVVAAIAAYLPARRAGRVDPMVAVRR